MPMARCISTTAATAPESSDAPAPSRYGRLPTCVVRILCVLRCMPSVVDRVGSVGRILDHRIGLELDVEIAVADLLHPAEIDVVHDFARRRIDGDRAARAFPRSALH